MADGGDERRVATLTMLRPLGFLVVIGGLRQPVLILLSKCRRAVASCVKTGVVL